MVMMMTVMTKTVNWNKQTILKCHFLFCKRRSSTNVASHLHPLHPLLIIFDLNGTLLDRRTKRYRPLAGNHENLPEPDFKLNSKYFYYLRPHLQQLLDYCFKYYQVGIWTSALPSNAYSSVVRVLGPSLTLDSTMLDFEGPGALSEQKCQANASMNMSLLETGSVEFDWLSPDSFVSEQETRIRLDALAQLKQLKESARLSGNSPIMTYPLSLLWTRRRCILRNTCALDRTDNPYKPAAMKDVSQLWKRTKATRLEKGHENPLSCSTRYVIGENHSAKKISLSTDSPSMYVPEPFYHPPIPYYSDAQGTSKNMPSIDAHLEQKLKFKPTHTLIVDDSEYKFALTQRNGLVLPEYDISKDPLRKDVVLLKLVEYLENYRVLGKKVDIRHYMEQFPFRQFCLQTAAGC